MKTEEMNVLIVSGGGREHTLVWKVIQSPRVKKTFVAPGNAGTALIAQNLPIKDTDIDGLLRADRVYNFDLVIVGGEDPLAAGITESFQEIGVPILAPSRMAAEAEISKIFCYKLMEKYRIPCPPAADFSDYGKAVEYVKGLSEPPVIKADGLAKGKGVTVCETIEQALETLRLYMVDGIHGVAGRKVLAQKRIKGREASVIAFTDGKTVVIVPPACDYKNVSDGNQGPMTGGMGSFAPSDFLKSAMIEKIRKTIIEPFLEAMRKEGRPYKGIIYFGLIFPEESPENPEVLEVNARGGDPETQVQIPLLKTDLVDIALAIIQGRLSEVKVEWEDLACVGVVMASEGYPGKPITNRKIIGLNDVDKDITVFHAGTKVGGPGEILTSGGRVLALVAADKTLTEARDKVYANISLIHFEGCYYRKDIALL